MKSKTRLTCRIRNCEKITAGGIDYCCDCNDFPCKPLLHLDLRYRTKYGMSMIGNLANIDKFGIREFVKMENKKWRCRQCGETICVHKAGCLSCGHVWNKS